VFLTKHHLGIALEYADGGDLSEYIDNHAQQGVSMGNSSLCVHKNCCEVSLQTNAVVQRC
jgi:hypothetical protein